MDNRLDQQIGSYRLIRELGAGGFSNVYLGEHIHLSTLAAIKVLRTQLRNEDIEEFRTEARTVAQLEPYLIMTWGTHTCTSELRKNPH